MTSGREGPIIGSQAPADPRAGTPDRARDPVDETTILIVDDEPRVLDALEAILAAEFRVLRAGHGEEALACLAAERDVAVILTDQRMPGMTGVELIEHVRAEHPGLAIVLATGYAELPPGVLTTVPRVAKPFMQDQLLRVVREAMAAPAAEASKG